MKKRMNELKVGEKGIVAQINSKNDLKRRLLDIGLVSGGEIECVGVSPLGDPSAYLIKGAVIAVRDKDCRKIIVNVQTP